MESSSRNKNSRSPKSQHGKTTVTSSSNSFEASLRAHANASVNLDSSMLKKIKKNREKTLKIQQEAIKSSRIKHKTLKKQFQIVDFQLIEAGMKIRDQNALTNLMEKSATKIQKVFRGYYSRKIMETVFDK